MFCIIYFHYTYADVLYISIIQQQTFKIYDKTAIMTRRRTNQSHILSTLISGSGQHHVTTHVTENDNMNQCHGLQFLQRNYQCQQPRVIKSSETTYVLIFLTVINTKMRLLAQHALTDKKHNIHPQLLVTKSTIYRSLYHCLHTHTLST